MRALYQKLGYCINFTVSISSDPSDPSDPFLLPSKTCLYFLIIGNAIIEGRSSLHDFFGRHIIEFTREPKINSINYMKKSNSGSNVESRVNRRCLNSSKSTILATPFFLRPEASPAPDRKGRCDDTLTRGTVCHHGNETHILDKDRRSFHPIAPDGMSLCTERPTRTYGKTHSLGLRRKFTTRKHTGDNAFISVFWKVTII